MPAPDVGKVTAVNEPEDVPVAAPDASEAETVLVAAAAMDEPEDSYSGAASIGDESEDVLVTAQKIDEFFAKARLEKAVRYGSGASIVQELLRSTDQFTAVDFVKSYRAGGIYPEDRLKELVLRFTDVRLQEWYIQSDAGMSNEHYYGPIHLDPNLADSAGLKLSLMATTQSMISRSRIAWEKLMRAVYYLETGQDLQPSGSRSYKSKFFDWVGKQPKWLFLEPYKSVVSEHDDRFRTGEFHKGSVLRRVILGHEMPDLNKVMELSNCMLNGIWPNILDIVQGGWPHRFSNLHLVSGSQSEIDLRYMPPKNTT
jgi:hypothetical protein